MKDWNIIERDFIEWDNSTHSNASQRQILDWFKEHLIPESGQTNEEYLAECIEKAEPNLSKIKDVDKELAEIRGIETIGSTTDFIVNLQSITDSDIEVWAEDQKCLKIYMNREDAFRDGIKKGAKAVLNNEIKHNGREV
jgi:hypothetical protein